MKITLVCGLLGAKKTSFIRNCIDSADEKTVVLVNDFGSLGIDGEIISSGGLDTVELPSGCVCCSLKMDLIEALKRIDRDMHPEHLVIEPSGLASPTGVLEAIEVLEYSRVDVVGIVDATEFLGLYEEEIFGRFFLEQVELSDIVLVNKADLTDSETIARTRSVIEGINPRALVVETIHAKLEGGIPELEGGPKDLKGHGHALDFSVMSFKFDRSPSVESIRELYTGMVEGKFGKIVRSKALIETTSGALRFDLAWGKYDEASLESAPTSSRLVVIGPSVDEAAIKDYLA